MIAQTAIKVSILLLNAQKWSEKDMKHFMLTIKYFYL